MKKPTPATTRANAALMTLLRRGPWRSLPSESLESLAIGATLSEFSPAHIVYTEADAERLAVIARGLVRVYMNARDGRQVTVRYVRDGELLGVPALVGGPAPVFVQAITGGAAYFLDVARVKQIARSDATVAWALAEESVHRLYDVLEELAGNAFATVRQRLVRHLLDLAANQTAEHGRLSAVVNQQDLANAVGSVREVVARILRELRADDLVKTSPGRIDILDPFRLGREMWSRA